MNACRQSWLLALMIVFATACSKPEEPRRAEATVHGVTVRAPMGWSVIDEKQQQVVITPPPLSDAELRELDRGGRISTKSNAAVRVRDLGPVTPAGMQHAVAVVRETWRSGRAAEAKVLLFKVPLRSELVPSLAPPSDFARAWTRVRHGPAAKPYDDVAADLAAIIAGLDAVPTLALPAIVDWALPRVDATRLTSMWHLSGGNFDGEENDDLAGRPDAQRRDVVWRKTVTVDGREAEEIETWDNLTHALPRRLLFIVNDDHLIVVTSEVGGREHSLDAYEMVRSSIRVAR